MQPGADAFEVSWKSSQASGHGEGEAGIVPVAPISAIQGMWFTGWFISSLL
jgi:hypothetical protein